VVDEAMVDGVQGEFQAVGDAEFVEDIVQVILDGLFADEELLADLFVAITLGDELHDLFSRSLNSGFIPPRPVFGTLAKLSSLRRHAVIEPISPL